MFERERCEVPEFSLIFRLTKRLQAGMSSAAASEAKAQYTDWLAGCYGWYLRLGNILSILKFMAAVKLKCFSAFLSKFLLQRQDRSYDSSKLTFPEF